jgi:hypothetical protein
VELESFLNTGGCIDRLLHAKRIKGTNISYDDFERLVSGEPRTAAHPVSAPSDSIQTQNSFSTEIMTHIDFGMAQYITGQLVCPHMKAVHFRFSSRKAPHHLLNRISKNLPRLQLLSISGERIPLLLWFHDALRLAELTILIINIGASLISCQFKRWELPSLKHLEMSEITCSLSLDHFLRVLSYLGQGLTTLIIGYVFFGHKPEQIPLVDIWNSCPVLECLGIPLWDILFRPPPPSHSLRYLFNTHTQQAMYRASSAGLQNDLHIQTLRFREAASNLAVLRDLHDWGRALSTDKQSGNKGSEPFPVRISKDLKGIRFEDSSGRTLLEYEASLEHISI